MKWVLPLFLAGAISSAYGLGFRVPDQDPYATARGNAFAATADHPGAVYYNPAGITQLSGVQARVGTYSIYWRSKFEGPGGRTAETDNGVAALPQVYSTYSPEDSPISVGIGLFSPYGLGVEWPDNAPFSMVATEGELRYLSLKPVLAWEIHPNLSVAAGPTINYGETDLRRRMRPQGEFRFEGDAMGFGYGAGILWRPVPRHSFGVNYRSVTTLDLEGTSEAEGFGLRDEDAEARIDFPQHIMAGWSYRPTPRWNLEFNVDWTDWERLDTVTLEQSFGSTRLPFLWKSSFFLEWGATHTWPSGFSVSGGYIFSENSVPDSSFSPLVPDSDRHILSLGVGWERGDLRGDVAYQFGYGPTRDVQGSRPGVADGDYQFVSHALSLAFQYRF